MTEQENNTNKEIPNFVVNQRNKIKIYTLILAGVFLWYGLSVEQGAPYKFFCTIGGILFLVTFLAHSYFGERIASRDIEYYKKHKKFFKFSKNFSVVINAFLLIQWIWIVILLLIAGIIFFIVK